MQSKEIVQFLKTPESAQLFSTFRNYDPVKLLLKAKSSKNEGLSIVAGLLQLYKKAVGKLPTYVKKQAALTLRSYEQASSEKVAGFHANLMACEQLLNLTGGLGVDDIAFSKTCKNVLSIDPDDELNVLADYNFKIFGCNNIQRITTTAEEFLHKNATRFDVIYIDPDRRPGSGRTYHINNSLPDVVALQHILTESADAVFIKLSPMVDLTQLHRLFKAVADVYVVSEDNEVKEVLLSLNANALSCTTKAIILTGNVKLNIDAAFKADMPLERSQILLFAEPDAALIKSGLDEYYFNEIGWNKCGPNARFYTGFTIPPDFAARCFELKQVFEFKPTLFKSLLKELKITQAHIKCRDFPLKPDDLKKRFKLKDGGVDYFFFYKDNTGKLIGAHAVKPEIRNSLF